MRVRISWRNLPLELVFLPLGTAFRHQAEQKQSGQRRTDTGKMEWRFENGSCISCGMWVVDMQNMIYPLVQWDGCLKLFNLPAVFSIFGNS